MVWAGLLLSGRIELVLMDGVLSVESYVRNALETAIATHAHNIDPYFI